MESVVVVLAVTVFDITVPSVTEVFTRTCTGKVTVPFTEIGLGDEQLIWPVPPTAGVIHVHPAGGVRDLKLTSAGRLSTKLGLAAAAGPLFVNTIV